MVRDSLACRMAYSLKSRPAQTSTSRRSSTFRRSSPSGLCTIPSPLPARAPSSSTDRMILSRPVVVSSPGPKYWGFANMHDNLGSSLCLWRLPTLLSRHARNTSVPSLLDRFRPAVLDLCHLHVLWPPSRCGIRQADHGCGILPRRLRHLHE